MRACEVVPFAWDATGSVRDHPTPKRTGHRLSTAPELTVREPPTPRHLPSMNPIRLLLATLTLTAATPALPAVAAPALRAGALPPHTALVAPAIASVAPAAASPPHAQPQAATWPLQPRPRVVRGFDLPAKP